MRGGSGPASRRGGQVSQPTGRVRSSRGGGQVGQLMGGSGPASGGGGGQHLAPSCGRYASCVHAGGLSCFIIKITHSFAKENKCSLSSTIIFLHTNYELFILIKDKFNVCTIVFFQIQKVVLHFAIVFFQIQKVVLHFVRIMEPVNCRLSMDLSVTVLEQDTWVQDVIVRFLIYHTISDIGEQVSLLSF